MAGTKKFSCKVMTSKGRIEQRIMEAENKAIIENTIRRNGEKPIEINDYVEAKANKDLNDIQLFQKKVKSKDLSIFCKQMHTMLYAGMPLLKALGVMSEQLEHPTLKKATKEMMGGVQKGYIFSDVMKQQGKIFPPLLISMVESGEMTGKQDEVLEKMSIHYEKEDKVEKKIKGALVYPKFLTVLVILVIYIMLTKIFPKFIGLFESSGVELPWPTRFMMAFSKSLVNRWYVYLAVILILVFGFKAFVRSKGGKRTWDRFLLALPGIKKSQAKIATSRFTRTLSTLLSSGLPLLASLQMAGKVTGNTVVEDGINRITEDIKKGSKLSYLIKQISVFPPMLVSMVSIGEESGALEDMLERTSDFYDSELEDSLSKMVGLIEPLMIVVMGIIIGFVVISMMLPMMSLFKAYR